MPRREGGRVGVGLQLGFLRPRRNYFTIRRELACSYRNLVSHFVNTRRGAVMPSSRAIVRLFQMRVCTVIGETKAALGSTRLEGLRELRARLFVKKKGSEPFVILLERLQLVLGPFTAGSVIGGGGGGDMMASPADVNQNDMVTATDAEIFFADFGLGAPAADVNNDGVVDQADVVTFVEAFGGGRCWYRQQSNQHRRGDLARCHATARGIVRLELFWCPVCFSGRSDGGWNGPPRTIWHAWVARAGLHLDPRDRYGLCH